MVKKQMTITKRIRLYDIVRKIIRMIRKQKQDLQTMNRLAYVL